MTIDILTWIAIISAIAALAAAWYAARSTHIAQKALEIARRQEKRQESNLELYLINAYIKRFKNQQFRVYVFQLNVSNKADATNSMKRIDLVIEGEQIKEVRNNFIVLHDPGLSALMPDLEVHPFQSPTTISAHETLTGHALFRIEDDLLQNSTIETYLLKITDTHGSESHIEAIFISEAKDE